MEIAAAATRDGMTLARQASVLLSSERHGRARGILKKYVGEYGQYAADEVREIVADMEAFVDPKIVEQNKRIQAERDARAEARREKEEAEEKAAWEPGGRNFSKALGQMEADAHTLIFAAKTIEDSDDQRLIGVLRGYCEDEARSRLFARLAEALKPPPKVSPPPAKRCSRKRPNGQDDKVVRLFNDT